MAERLDTPEERTEEAQKVDVRADIAEVIGTLKDRAVDAVGALDEFFIRTLPQFTGEILTEPIRTTRKLIKKITDRK